MMKFFPKSLNLPLVLLTVCFAFLAGYNAIAPKQPAVIGTVDVERMFMELKAQQAADETDKQLRSDMQSEIDAKQKKVSSLTDDMQYVEPGTEQYQRLERELEKASLDYRSYAEFASQTVELRRAESWRTTYLDIREAAKKFSDSNGIDAVFLDDSVPRIASGGTTDQVLEQISGRRIIYVADPLDITDDLLKMMNQEFMAGAKER